MLVTISWCLWAARRSPAFRSAEHDVLKQHHEEPEREASRCLVRAAVLVCVRDDLMPDRRGSETWQQGQPIELGAQQRGSDAGAAVLLVRRRLRREHTLGLDKLSEAQGLVIWVQVRSPEKEAEAQEILMRHGGEAVHVHEIELAKRPEDLPLHSLRVDPWLGDERLGRP